MNVPYDRTFYDKEYVRKEVFGVRDSVDRGYMHWNNGGNYSKLSPDVGNEKYNGRANEAKSEFRKPAIGVTEEKIKKDVDELSFEDSITVKEKIILWDSVYNQGDKNL